MADWNGLIRHRRAMGLWAFAYASAHLLLYAILDAGSWAALWMEVGEKTYLMIGIMAWTAMLPLALTSNQRAIRALKKNWQRLHRLAYAAGLLAVAHLVLQAKAGDDAHLPWVAAALLVGGLRLLAWRLGDKGPAQIVQRSGPPPPV
ncbi:MAG: ferric reductase-like transmembrane domain-containing protein [Rubrivivax sp.]|jgi:sulfoxide reductase heme-binding subunit YedZ|nr:ferric reductase-like transmembrane domain-containing protein [Rubrivivax sp.]